MIQGTKSIIQSSVVEPGIGVVIRIMLIDEEIIKLLDYEKGY